VIARPAGAHTIPGALLSKEELRSCIIASHEAGVVDEASAQMLARVVKFGDRSVREIMTPRTEAVWIEEGATLADFQKVYAKAPHVRYPVFQNNRDNVKGVVFSREVHMALAQGKLTSNSIVTHLARPVHYVPGTKLVGELFNEMRDRGFLMAIVVSEYGGTSGIVTIQQLVEEIVGEVREEVVATKSDFEVIGPDAYQVEGNMRVADVNEKLGLKIPKDKDFDTIAGFVLHTMGHLPERGEFVTYEDLTFTVTEVKGKRIVRLVARRETPKEVSEEVIPSETANLETDALG
jgi:CBS domain containing-hemolysin-like protein